MASDFELQQQVDKVKDLIKKYKSNLYKLEESSQEQLDEVIKEAENKISAFSEQLEKIEDSISKMNKYLSDVCEDKLQQKRDIYSALLNENKIY